MAKSDANPPMPEFRDDYVLQEVDAAWLSKAVKPKQFIHIDQSECIMCEGCVDICPWKCIHMVTTEAVDEAIGVDQPGLDPSDHVVFLIDDDVAQLLVVDRERRERCVEELPLADRGELLRGRPTQLVVRPLQPLVGNDAIHPEHQRENQGSGEHRLTPAERRADRPAPAVQDHGSDTQEADHDLGYEGDHLARDSS